VVGGPSRFGDKGGDEITTVHDSRETYLDKPMPGLPSEDDMVLLVQTGQRKRSPVPKWHGVILWASVLLFLMVVGWIGKSQFDRNQKAKSTASGPGEQHSLDVGVPADTNTETQAQLDTTNTPGSDLRDATHTAGPDAAKSNDVPSKTADTNTANTADSATTLKKDQRGVERRGPTTKRGRHRVETTPNRIPEKIKVIEPPDDDDPEWSLE
jgi:cytoskeletal protein RodZ